MFQRRLHQYEQRPQSDDSSSSSDYGNSKQESALFTEEETAQIVKAILKGLGPLHNLNYIHRDIKPENIILAPLVSSAQESSPQKKTADVNPD